MQIRAERSEDKNAVYAVNLNAFDSPFEAKLVDKLRDQAQPFVSLVAEVDGSIVGHIAFSSATLLEHPDLSLMGLAPVAVLPAHHRQGIGSALIRAGLEQTRQLGALAVVVLGHPEYYPRFGFHPASRYGLRCEYEVPDEAFMAIELEPESLSGKSGLVRYHPAFSQESE